ncbi:GNAT family N-acetyltransferase [Nereida sp. MMG025]|uniref:GNAT family N-acetyltransferase n=1 Tax=Nereida sp. MMG025 TaxID=2909981 RepID=UPI001F32C40C|nr:GNAT family N-acyltransferase [Nereida sp. MMG025]MCF6443404.1 GNAT family N-acetyltransferase [Nereida sp. MMG025]
MPDTPDFLTRLAQNEADLRAAQTLRYQVFVKELGADGPLVDHAEGLEKDAFDPFYDHLLLIDRAGDVERVVGVYRLLRSDQAARAGRFYSEGEFDLSPLKQSGRRLLELGRSCLHPDYRGGTAMLHLWAALADYIADHQIDVLFGVASFHGTDAQALAHPLSNLHHTHLAPSDLRTRVLPGAHAQPLALLAREDVDRKRAMLETPQLIKAYLRLGGYVGDGAFIDRDFNTTDVCLILDAAKVNDKQAALFARGRGT